MARKIIIPTDGNGDELHAELVKVGLVAKDAKASNVGLEKTTGALADAMEALNEAVGHGDMVMKDLAKVMQKPLRGGILRRALRRLRSLMA